MSGVSGISIWKMQPTPGRFLKLISPPYVRTAFRAIESPSPRPLRSYFRRSAKARNGSVWASAMPPHSSSTSMSTRFSSRSARNVTVPPAGVYLNALFSRFMTAEATSCGSALTAICESLASTINRNSRTSAWSVPANAISPMNTLIGTRSCRAMFADIRMSDSVLSTRSRRFIRLLPSTVPVLPLMATVPRLSV